MLHTCVYACIAGAATQAQPGSLPQPMVKAKKLRRIRLVMEPREAPRHANVRSGGRATKQGKKKKTARVMKKEVASSSTTPSSSRLHALSLRGIKNQTSVKLLLLFFNTVSLALLYVSHITMRIPAPRECVTPRTPPDRGSHS